MPTISVHTLVLGGLGVFCLMIVLSQLSAVGGHAEEPVGPNESARPPAPQPALVPANFRSLIHGEATLWGRMNDWPRLVAQLDEIERRLGASPFGEDPPDEYTQGWLERKVTHIESFAGPLPSPMIRAEQAHPPRRFWTSK